MAKILPLIFSEFPENIIMEKGEKKLYVHAGIRITKSKNKVLVIFTLDDKGNIDKELHFEADAGDKNLLGLIFEGYFEDDTARLNRSITLQKGKFEDKSLLTQWIAEQNTALSDAKKTSLKPEVIKDLSIRLEPERKAYQSALKRGDLETAKSIKDLLELILTKPLN